MRTTITLVCTLLSAACASSQTAASGTATAPDDQQAYVHEAGNDNGNAAKTASACPMQVSNASVTAEEIEGGAALSFTTSDDVAQLRQRVRRMADMHNRHVRSGMMRDQSDRSPAAEEGEQVPPRRGQRGHGTGGRPGMMGRAMMQAEVRVEDVEGGARLVFTPGDPDQIAQLRDAVRHRAERMASSGQCPMMAQMVARRRGMRMQGMSGMCPMKVAGTTAMAEDVEGGVALRFTTTGNVDELQRRVASMAEMHSRRGGMMGGAMMQAEVRAENVDSGARLVFTPRDADKLPELQQQVRMRAERMSSGQCPMMSRQGGTGEGGTPVGEDE